MIDSKYQNGLVAEKRVRFVSIGDHDTSTVRDGSKYKLVARYRRRDVTHPWFAYKTQENLLEYFRKYEFSNEQVIRNIYVHTVKVIDNFNTGCHAGLRRCHPKPESADQVRHGADRPPHLLSQHPRLHRQRIGHRRRLGKHKI